MQIVSCHMMISSLGMLSKILSTEFLLGELFHFVSRVKLITLGILQHFSFGLELTSRQEC